MGPFDSNTNINNKDIVVLGDYLEPILDKIQAKKDENDYEMQFAIASSLENVSTDSDDTDDTISTTSENTKRSKKIKKNTSFAAYWQEMNEFNKTLQKNLKYIMKQNKSRQNKQKTDKKQEWKDHGTLNFTAYRILRKNPILMNKIPSIKQIYNWLTVRWQINEFKIKNILTPFVLNNKFL